MNLPTIIVASIVAVIFLLIVIHEIRKRKAGKASCGGSCCSCGMSCSCHAQTGDHTDES